MNRIIIVGTTGSGKSTVAKQLANRLNVTYKFYSSKISRRS